VIWKKRKGDPRVKEKSLFSPFTWGRGGRKGEHQIAPEIVNLLQKKVKKSDESSFTQKEKEA